jgi:hypothetical protein
VHNIRFAHLKNTTIRLKKRIFVMLNEAKHLNLGQALQGHEDTSLRLQGQFEVFLLDFFDNSFSSAQKQ